MKTRVAACFCLIILLMLHPEVQAQSNTARTWIKCPLGNAPPIVDNNQLLYDSDRDCIVLIRAYLNNVYECDLAGHWTIKNQTSFPSPRRGHLGVYDSERRQIMIFGGSTGFYTYFNETWTWDGTRWTQLAPAHAPAARAGHAIAYDSKRKCTLLFGGVYYDKDTGQQSFGDTWQWDGMDWTQLHPAQSPQPQAYANMVYDSARDRMVLFTGNGQNGQSPTETWEWDGSNWSQCMPANNPTARTAVNLVYDSHRNRTLLFGGYQLSPSLIYRSDTWEWDGANWTQLSTSTTPQDHSGGYMLYVPDLDKTYLFSGFMFSGESTYPQNAWWAWDGKNWADTTMGDAPPPRSYCSMAYDEDRKCVVMFGGSTTNALSLSDTWEWDGTHWTRRYPAAAPPPRCGASLAYDPSHKAMILFGGFVNSPFQYYDDTWMWDGTNWTKLNPATHPPEQYLATMAYDRTQGYILLNNGTAPGYKTIPPGTWQWDGTNWKLCQPQLQPGTGGVIGYDTTRHATLLMTSTDLYSWDGNTANWTRLNVSPKPRGRDPIIGAFNPDQGEILLFGGRHTSQPYYLNDTWIESGARWTALTLPTSPAAIVDHTMVYDGARQSFMIFGGVDSITGCLQDTWLFIKPNAAGGWEKYR